MAPKLVILLESFNSSQFTGNRDFFICVKKAGGQFILNPSLENDLLMLMFVLN